MRKCRLPAKRQRTGALQNASRISGIIVPRASVLDCGGPPPLFRSSCGNLADISSADKAPPMHRHRFSREHHQIQASLTIRSKAFSRHAGTQNPLAARTHPSACRTRHLFCHRLNLPEVASFSRGKTTAGFTSWFADSGGTVWLATGSVGGVLESLSLGRSFTRRYARCFQFEHDVKRVARQDFRMGEQTRQRTGTTSVVQLLGHTVDASTVVSDAVELCASERGETWVGAGGLPVSVVFGGVV
jgi:hypothetical protein